MIFAALRAAFLYTIPTDRNSALALAADADLDRRRHAVLYAVDSVRIHLSRSMCSKLPLIISLRRQCGHSF